ncbi:hypothetical protein [Pseudoxanthomonas mexicana]|uniref:hypothetical protein n=1 Tax=Pseudoxanthomonas mexicana TaxID=128785 RepID=UPI0022F3FBD8|nr:hypothetical protein [Pseudoxanthomonas mexicana]WBX93817.1 hypothetical protein PE064_00950 [Pseudoxanthomonas mexicana]
MAGKPCEPKVIVSWLPSGLSMRRAGGAGGESVANVATSSIALSASKRAGSRCSFEAPKFNT